MRLCSRMNLLRFARTGFAERAVTFVKQTLVMIAGLAALNATAQNATQVDVQIYENTTVFPGESRFFMTARALDKNFLAANPQMGWVKLDTFAAYAVEPGGGAAPSEPKLADVCRFYLPTLATHFFTADSVECERFKADPLFKFEGVDFAVARPVAGVCAAGLSSLVRFYNQGQKRNVSGNHFYGTGTSVGIGNYLARFAAWRSEGVVMCVPETTKASTQAIFAGRGEAVEPPGTAALSRGLPIAQVVNVDSLQSTTFVDTLGGDSDWITRTAFDELRGKLYLIRANTLLVACCLGNTLAPGVPPPFSAFVSVRPTRASYNVVEMDVATGSMRYLAIDGAYTDVHYNAERRLLLLASSGTNQVASLTWFDPARNAVVSTASYGGVAYDARLRHIGKSACEYLLEKASFTDVITLIPWWSVLSTHRTSCVDSDGSERALPTQFAVGSLAQFDRGGCIVGDSFFAGFSQLNLTGLGVAPSLPRVDFGWPSGPSESNYQMRGCYSRGNSLYAVIFASYANRTTGYFVAEYRNGLVVRTVGPLTEQVNWYPDASVVVFQPRQPAFLVASDARFILKGDNTTELWAVNPRYVEPSPPPVAPPRNLLQRINVMSFQPISEIEIALPSRDLHLSTR